ncbi:helix-turn-helix domain-containing protein [Actinoplanes sp. L3-i22]|uniref:helix-turn-helix domain-containing protein n=1 Tax=Actinoplanes sp. L3-i22 TaxID=2836373 RepID=UPI001C8609E5|nr:helix-turn-helix domain-containing protein [Actinoplanes sp. L3-i22]
MDSFGVLLRHFRLAAGLTLEGLCAASGVSDRAISDMEREISKRPRARTVQALADGLRLTGADQAAFLAAARAGRAGGAGRPALVPLADFIGRAPELARIREWIAHTPSPVVVISGSPGFGKTALAVQAAAAWPVDQRLFVDLRGLDDEPLTPSAVLGELIRAIDPAAKALPRDVEEASALWRSLVRDRPVVVVLDNAISEGQVRPALPGEGPAAVLVTSRRALSGLESVRRLRLAAFPPEDAVTLLAAIVDDRAIAPAGLRAIADLCVHVPLALRIAGNRLVSIPRWTADDLIARLASHERRLDTLATEDLQIKAAFTLSYQQLSDAGQRLFRRLALIPGTSTGAGLAAILVRQPLPATEDALDELVDLGLLQQGSDGRLRFHDLLRLYAASELERAEDAGERAAVAARRDAWLLDTAILAGRFFEPGHGPPPPGATVPAELSSPAAADAWLRAEAENWLPAFRQAAADGSDQRVIDVAEAVHWFSDNWSFWPHWEDVYTLSAQAARRLGDDRLQAVHLGYLAWVHLVCLADPATAVTYARQAIEFAGRTADPGLAGWSNYYLAWALEQDGRNVEALPYARTAADLMRQAGDREGRPNAVILHAIMLHTLGRDEEAAAGLHDAIELVTGPATAPPEHIARFVEVTAYAILADIAITAEDWPAALGHVEASVRAAAPLAYAPTRELVTLSRRALVYARLGRSTEARADLDALAEIRKNAGDSAFGLYGAIQDRVETAESLLAG